MPSREHFGHPDPGPGKTSFALTVAAKLLAEAERTESEEDWLDGGGFAALAREADFDRVVFDGGEFGMTEHRGSAEEQDYLWLPGLLEPDQVKDLLRRHQDPR